MTYPRVESEDERLYRIKRSLFGMDDSTVLDEDGNVLIFERENVPKTMSQLTKVGDVDISHELELIEKWQKEHEIDVSDN